MVTYPSTYGVFEEEIKTIIDCVHSHGGQVRISLTGLTMAVFTCSEVPSINTINCYTSEVGNPYLLPSILLLHFSLLLSLLPPSFFFPLPSLPLHFLSSPSPTSSFLLFSYLSTVIAASTARRRALILVAYKSKTPAFTEHTGSHASISYPIVSVLGPKWDACITCIEVVGSPSKINTKKK